jgi:DNA-directed RNA polymerase subunit RPC12/RpoP
METKKFQKNDSGFVCVNCKKDVSPLNYTSRDHCPYCLYSLHIDINPGDRKNPCGGLLVPVLSEPKADFKTGFKIIFKCKKCKTIIKNKSASDDDKNLLIKLTNANYPC